MKADTIIKVLPFILLAIQIACPQHANAQVRPSSAQIKASTQEAYERNEKRAERSSKIVTSEEKIKLHNLMVSRSQQLMRVLGCENSPCGKSFWHKIQNVHEELTLELSEELTKKGIPEGKLKIKLRLWRAMFRDENTKSMLASLLLTKEKTFLDVDVFLKDMLISIAILGKEFKEAFNARNSLNLIGYTYELSKGGWDYICLSQYEPKLLKAVKAKIEKVHVIFFELLNEMSSVSAYQEALLRAGPIPNLKDKADISCKGN